MTFFNAIPNRTKTARSSKLSFQPQAQDRNYIGLSQACARGLREKKDLEAVDDLSARSEEALSCADFI